MGRPKHTVPATEPPKRVWVTQVYVANQLGVTTRTVREWTADGRLTGYRLNKRFVRYDHCRVQLQPTGHRHGISSALK
jgi:excisionase family DNA binding protein